MSPLGKIYFRGRPVLLLSLITSIALLIRYFIAAQDIAYLDRIFLPDDTYYVLSISRSMAAGLGPSADGFQLTNGFQPLISFLQLPFFWFGPTDDQAVMLAIYLSVFWGGCSTFILGYLLLLIANERAAIIGSIIWIVCSIIIKNDLNGMETSLSGFLSLVTLLCAVLVDKEKSSLRLLYLGVVSGLTLLARIDSCFLLAAIGIFGLWRWDFSSIKTIVIVALVVVSPWWLYSFLTFGTVIPQSGFAVKAIVDYRQMSIVHKILVSLYGVDAWLPFFKLIQLFPLPGILVGSILSCYVIGKGVRQSGRYGLLLILPLILQLCFYTFYLPAFWFFTRYYYFIYIVIVITFSLTLSSLKESVSLPIFVIVVLAYGVGLVHFFAKPNATIDVGIDGAKGYRDIALAIRTQLSKGDTLGSMQTGALSYYLPKSIRVLNLDGVVNSDAAKAVKQKNFKNYVDKQHMTHFADWEFNVRMFKKYYGGVLPESCFIPIYQTKEQGGDQFTLYSYRPDCKV